LAIGYGDEFPFLVTKPAKEAGTFYGCVVRGVVYLEHIIPARPAEMTIERYLPRESAYLGSLV
jgi:hypothetical protein